MSKAELPEGRICHLTGHRARIRIRDRTRDAAFFESVRELLSSWPSVEQVEVNPITASVLVYFRSIAGLFADHQERNDLFRLVTGDPEDGCDDLTADPLIHRARHFLAAVDRRVHEGSGGGADLRALAFLGLMTAGVVQLLNGRISAPAATMFWYAGDLLGMIRPSDRKALSEAAAFDEAQEKSGSSSAHG